MRDTSNKKMAWVFALVGLVFFGLIEITSESLFLAPTILCWLVAINESEHQRRRDEKEGYL